MKKSVLWIRRSLNIPLTLHHQWILLAAALFQYLYLTCRCMIYIIQANQKSPHFPHPWYVLSDMPTWSPTGSYSISSSWSYWNHNYIEPQSNDVWWEYFLPVKRSEWAECLLHPYLITCEWLRGQDEIFPLRDIENKNGFHWDSNHGNGSSSLKLRICTKPLDPLHVYVGI